MMSSPGVEEGGTLLGSSCITPSLSTLSNYLTIYTAPVEHHGPRRADEVVRDAGQPAGGVGQPVVRPGQGALVQTLGRCGQVWAPVHGAEVGVVHAGHLLHLRPHELRQQRLVLPLPPALGAALHREEDVLWHVASV